MDSTSWSWWCEWCETNNIKLNTDCFNCKKPKDSLTADSETKLSGKIKDPRRTLAHRSTLRSFSTAGDWDCPTCQCVNFAKRPDCYSCRTPRPYEIEADIVTAPDVNNITIDGWACGSCGFHNFEHRDQCYDCKAQRETVDSQYKSTEGDWDCPSCTSINFSKRPDCYSCKTAKPPEDSDLMSPLSDPDWVCAECQTENDGLGTYCTECGQMRNGNGKKKRGKKKVGVTPGQWECLTCSAVNDKINPLCLTCNASAPQPNSTAKQAAASGNYFAKCKHCTTIEQFESNICTTCKIPNIKVEAAVPIAPKPLVVRVDKPNPTVKTSSAVQSIQEKFAPVLVKWECEQCKTRNFPGRKACMKCFHVNGMYGPKPLKKSPIKKPVQAANKKSVGNSGLECTWQPGPNGVGKWVPCQDPKECNSCSSAGVSLYKPQKKVRLLPPALGIGVCASCHSVKETKQCPACDVIDSRNTEPSKPLQKPAESFSQYFPLAPPVKPTRRTPTLLMEPPKAPPVPKVTEDGWKCLECNILNIITRVTCKQCNMSRSVVQGEEGELPDFNLPQLKQNLNFFASLIPPKGPQTPDVSPPKLITESSSYPPQPHPPPLAPDHHTQHQRHPPPPGFPPRHHALPSTTKSLPIHPHDYQYHPYHHPPRGYHGHRARFLYPPRPNLEYQPRLSRGCPRFPREWV